MWPSPKASGRVRLAVDSKFRDGKVKVYMCVLFAPSPFELSNLSTGKVK